jgi:cytochrome d ubiquinol oxidase subunit I
MSLDPILLSRFQFVWVVAFHVMLPAFTIGIASFIAFMEGLHFFTKRVVYLRISTFWIRIFSVAFGMGVVSGIVMPFQFGTNWSRFSLATANVLSPLLGYEGLTAFFLEATFLGVLLFGRRLVPPWMHFVAALMVAFGTLFSAFWILSVNSWMQTPAGYALIGGRFFPKDWWQIIFNPSFPYRLTHTVCAFYVTTGFVVLGVAAYLIRRGQFVEEGRVILSTTLWLLLVLVPLQFILGDLHGLNTLKYQPVKIAAMEGYWGAKPGGSVPLILFGWPDMKDAVTLDQVEIPHLGSIILTHSWAGSIHGLDDFPPEDRPNSPIVFWTFRIMVGIGFLMLALVAIGNLMRLDGRVYGNGVFLKVCEIGAPLGFIAVLAGWTTTEVGRQPWTVYGLLRTVDSVSPSLTGAAVLISFVGYIVVYLIIFPAGLIIMARILRRGPEATAPDEPIESGRPEQPVYALPAASSSEGGQP